LRPQACSRVAPSVAPHSQLRRPVVGGKEFTAEALLKLFGVGALDKGENDHVLVVAA
jgi:hypothetical protein